MRIPRNQPAHNLMPKFISSKVPALYSQEKNPDPTVWAKYFTPDSRWTWFVTEYDPAERLCFGLVEGQETEMGYFSLDELEDARGPMGLPIERDLHFKPQPLSQIKAKLERAVCV